MIYITKTSLILQTFQNRSSAGPQKPEKMTTKNQVWKVSTKNSNYSLRNGCKIYFNEVFFKKYSNLWTMVKSNPFLRIGSIKKSNLIWHIHLYIFSKLKAVLSIIFVPKAMDSASETLHAVLYNKWHLVYRNYKF